MSDEAGRGTSDVDHDERCCMTVAGATEPHDICPGIPVAGRVSSPEEQERCPYQCGIWEIHARDGVTYFPPLVEVADCGLFAGHPGECVP